MTKAKSIRNISPHTEPKWAYFVVGFLFCMVTSAVYFLGNPSLSNGIFYWHYIPEMLGLFFYGYFIATFPFFTIKFASALVVFTVVTALLIVSLLAAVTFTSLCYGLALCSPLLIGSFVGRKD